MLRTGTKCENENSILGNVKQIKNIFLINYVLKQGSLKNFSKTEIFLFTVGSPLFTKISSVPYRTVPVRTVPYCNRPSIVLKIAHHLNGFSVKNAI